MHKSCLTLLLGLVIGCAFCGGIRGQEESGGRPQQDEPAEDYQLELVQAMWRHGNRTAVLPEPGHFSEFIKITEPYGIGQLTPSGRRSSLRMGQFLRNYYGNFLPPYFTYTSASIACTQLQRTQETAFVGMASLWPPAGPQVWQDEGLGQLWTPIPCKYVPLIQDKEFFPIFSCPRIIELLLKAAHSPEFLLALDNVTDFGMINRYISINEDFIPVGNIALPIVYDYFNSLESNGFNLPLWSKIVYPQPLKEIYGMYIRLFAGTPEISKLVIGEFWKQTMDIATSLERGNFTPTDRVFIGYSVHDINVASALNSLNLIPENEPPPVPPFNAVFLIEWYRDKSNSSRIGAKFVYRNDTVGDSTITLTLPGCTEICPLDKVREAVAHLISHLPRAVSCLPLQPVTLENFEEYLEITKLWQPPEFIPEYRKLVQNYLNGQPLDLS